MVKCLVENCGMVKKSLPAHLRLVHNLSTAEYKAQYNTVDIGYSWGDKAKENKASREADAPADEPNSDIIKTLTGPERQLYRDRYKVLWQASNEDPVIASTIHEVVMNEIFIRRYQLQIQKLNKSGEADPKAIAAMHDMINKMQKQSLDLLNSLNLTKEKRDQLNKSPESTPSRLVTAIALVCANMTPWEQQKNQKDIEEAMNRLRKHTDELLTIMPAEASPDAPIEAVEIDG